jgi:DNA-binding transcriptional ArsR family regulator
VVVAERFKPVKTKAQQAFAAKNLKIYSNNAAKTFCQQLGQARADLPGQSTGWLTLLVGRLRTAWMEAKDATDLDLVFAALADRTRRAILSALMSGDRSVSELAEPFAMSLAAISKHIRILVGAGLVAQQRRGRVVTCRGLPEGLRAAGIWLQGVGGFDAEDYDALERLLHEVLPGEDDLDE